MRRLAVALFVLALSLAAHAAQAGIVVTVNKSAQELTVEVDGVTQYRWPVSTARWGYNTPNGTYRPQRLERQWYSRKYDWSPMPYSIFFAGGYAIHGSNEISRLGRPASHGCIRLHPKNAAVLFDLVKRNPGATRIDIVGGRPDAAPEKSPRRTGPQVEFRPRKRVMHEERIVRRRAVPAEESFEEIFLEPPRYRSRRAVQWDDF
ncbi:L,D-transpeptidase [Undibacter mobilis]|uniref:L,D-transpeptidase n=1 Tax=Undibacter mobilis TaxID=2292256 RepID=A0A371BAN4_9BRAD|nr:L,D-transpeptidase [Undibacter mobilis]